MWPTRVGSIRIATLRTGVKMAVHRNRARWAGGRCRAPRRSRSRGRAPLPSGWRGRASALSRVAMCRSLFTISTSLGASTSAASTSPGPERSMRRMRGPSNGPCADVRAQRAVEDRMASSFRLSMISVVSSTTPGMVENSCSTPSMVTKVTAAPGMEESSTRRSGLPRVAP